MIDYASYLDALDNDTLFKHISDQSGNGGIDKINDFENWYQEQFSGNLDALENKPKMVLVGLGADDRTKRMVTYLTKCGVDIALITFYAFNKDGHIFLAKQVEIELAEKDETQKQTYTKASNYENLMKLANKIKSTSILEKVSALIRNEMLSSYEWPGKTGRSFSLVEKTEEGKPTYRVYISVYLYENRPGSIQLVFHPRSIEAAGASFVQLKDKYNQELTPDKSGAFSIYLKDNNTWEGFSADLKIACNAMEKGWKDKLSAINEP